MAQKVMTIGQLAELAGVPDSTIRYYERTNLIRSAGRTAGNYRYFDHSAVERIEFIRAAQASGLSLEDIGTLLRFRDGDIASCTRVQVLIDARLDDVGGQLRRLRHVQGILRSYRAACAKTRRGDSCPVLIDLGRRSKRR